VRTRLTHLRNMFENFSVASLWDLAVVVERVHPHASAAAGGAHPPAHRDLHHGPKTRPWGWPTSRWTPFRAHGPNRSKYPRNRTLEAASRRGCRIAQRAGSHRLPLSRRSERPHGRVRDACSGRSAGALRGSTEWMRCIGTTSASRQVATDRSSKPSLAQSRDRGGEDPGSSPPPLFARERRSRPPAFQSA